MAKNTVPMRKCIGCNTSKPQSDLIRISFYKGKLKIDKGVKSNGRGVYVCKGSDSCIEQAKNRKAIYRNFHNVKENDVNNLFDELKKTNK